jgi:hypothetical protein
MSVITDNAEIKLSIETYRASLLWLYNQASGTTWNINRLKNFLMVLRVLKWDSTAGFLTRDQVRQLEGKIQQPSGNYNYL